LDHTIASSISCSPAFESAKSREIDLVLFVVVLDQRCCAARPVVAHVFREHLFEEIGYFERVVRGVPIDLLTKTLDHRRRQFHVAVADRAVFQILDVTGFKGETFEIAECGLTAEAADFEDGRVAFTQHAVAI
jgi:hypothetical protein